MKPRIAVAVEIGAGYVRAVKLAGFGGNGGNAMVSAYGERCMSPGLQGGERRDAILRAIRELAVDLGINGEEEVAVSIPRRYAIIWQVQMPLLAGEAIHSAVILEAESYLPYSACEAAIDFAIGDSVVGEPGSREVTIAAVKKDLVNEAAGLLKEAGLTPGRADLSTNALLEFWRATRGRNGGRMDGARTRGGRTRESSMREVIILLRDDEIEVCMVKDGKPETARAIPYRQILKGNTDSQGFKASGAGAGGGGMSPEQVIGELRATLAGPEGGAWHVDGGLILRASGLVSPLRPENSLENNSREVLEALKEALDGPLEELGFLGEKVMGIEAKLASAYAVPIGLALGMVSGKKRGMNRGMNFLSCGEVARSVSGSLRYPIMKAVLLALSAVLLTSAGWIVNSFAGAREAGEIRARLVKLEPIVTRADEIQARTSHMRGELRKLEELQKGRLRYLGLLREITLRMPGGAWIESIVLEGSMLKELRGKALSASLVMDALRKSPEFAGLRFSGPIVSVEVDGMNYEEFRITGTLSGEGSGEVPGE